MAAGGRLAEGCAGRLENEQQQQEVARRVPAFVLSGFEKDIKMRPDILFVYRLDVDEGRHELDVTSGDIAFMKKVCKVYIYISSARGKKAWVCDRISQQFPLSISPAL